MTDQRTTSPSVPTHGAARLPFVEVESYNVELKDEDGLLGDRASKGAFREILERWRKPLRKAATIRSATSPAARSAGKSSIRCSRRRPRGRRGRARRSRGLRAGARPRHPPVPQAQGVARYGEDRRRRRLSRQQGRRAHYRACSGDPEIGKGADRSRAHPQRPRRGRLDWRRAFGAALDVRGARRDHRCGHRRHQFPRRHRRAQLEKGDRPSKASVWKFELWRHADEKSSRAKTRSRSSSTC